MRRVVRVSGGTTTARVGGLMPAEAIAKAVRKLVDAHYAGETERRQPLYDSIIAVVEKPLIETVLARLRGNQVHAARSLGINRNTLRKKMRAHGIKVPPA